MPVVYRGAARATLQGASEVRGATRPLKHLTAPDATLRPDMGACISRTRLQPPPGSCFVRVRWRTRGGAWDAEGARGGASGVRTRGGAWDGARKGRGRAHLGCARRTPPCHVTFACEEGAHGARACRRALRLLAPRLHGSTLWRASSWAPRGLYKSQPGRRLRRRLVRLERGDTAQPPAIALVEGQVRGGEHRVQPEL